MDGGKQLGMKPADDVPEHHRAPVPGENLVLQTRPQPTPVDTRLRGGREMVGWRGVQVEPAAPEVAELVRPRGAIADAVGRSQRDWAPSDLATERDADGRAIPEPGGEVVDVADWEVACDQLVEQGCSGPRYTDHIEQGKLGGR